jgi:SAM-dependent methyltransferase
VSINVAWCRTDRLSFVPPRLPCRRSLQGRARSQQETIVEAEQVLSTELMDILSELVQRRAQARWQGNYGQADELRNELDDIDLPDGYSISLQDVPRKDGGGSSWSLVRNTTELLLEGTTVLQLAHAALGLALASSGRRIPVPLHQLQALIQQANSRLAMGEAVEHELRGRKAADAAFWFSLAGSHDEYLLQSLSKICTKELERFGTRASCRGKDVLHIFERFAAAGLRNNTDLEIMGKIALESKDASFSDSMDLLDFHSDRCLLMIWRFSTRQRKQRAFLESALKHWERQEQLNTGDAVENHPSYSSNRYDWNKIYDDPTKPLVIDIGCGMGVSLLGLAQQKQNRTNNTGQLVDDWSACNFVGVDLSGLAIGFGQGMSRRWGLDGRLHFVVDAAEEFLHRVIESYPGSIELCLVQFPTPYRLPKVLSGGVNDSRGNAQLPADTQNGFMVTTSLLRLIHQALWGTNGKLLLQSNCEDVAIWMKQTATVTVGFQPMDCSTYEIKGIKVPISMTKRTLDWIEMDGERAEGDTWSNGPVLPRIGRTETEVACSINGVPVHRCLLMATN